MQDYLMAATSLPATADFMTRLRAMKDLSILDALREMVADATKDKDHPVHVGDIRDDHHLIDDLGVDSLDFLDVAFSIHLYYGIKLPLEKWTMAVNDGKARTQDYVVLKALGTRIRELIDERNARRT